MVIFPLMRSIYDSIGHDYARTRQSDPRILSKLVEQLRLPLGARIADVGAGTGNYSNALADRGYIIKAIEPSLSMRRQAAVRPGVCWVAGVAESIPLADATVDGVVAILSYHHFSSPRQAISEMDRVCGRGSIVLFTFDPREVKSFWLADYFPEVWQAAFDAFPPIVEVERLMKEATGRSVRSEEFSLPHDLVDRFAAAGWRRPEVYLEAEVRAGMSAFRLADQTVVERGVTSLGNDLESGEWHRSYGWILEVESYDAGYRFVCVDAATGND